jgi:SNF2 family DNA or RNA helicase
MPDLYPFQKAGAKFLIQNKRAYLADEMGLGKTVQAIRAARVVGARWIVVVCPASVQENWKREWEAWGGPGELAVISYGKLIRLDAPHLTRRFDLVILDEAHYCKTPGSKRTKAALKLAASADRAWLLSGTPMPNDPRELWPVVKYLWPDIAARFHINNATQWMDRWCRWSEGEYGPRVWGLTPAAKTELVPALRTFMLRRRTREVALDLPPLRIHRQYLEKDPDLTARLIELGAEGDDEHMSRLRRILGSYKAPAIAREIVRELRDEAYKAIVVLYHHRDTGLRLRQLIESGGYRAVGFDGSTPGFARQEAIDAFQAGWAPVFLAQQTAAGTGITLTRASEIVLVEPSWSPADNEQAIKRIHRISQIEPCRARLFAVPGSLDDALMGTLVRKTRIVKEVVG